MSQQAWAKRPWFWLALGAVVAGFVAVGVVAAPKQQPALTPKPSPSPSVDRVAQLVAEAKAAEQQQQAAQAIARAERQANQPRLIEYYIRGTTNGATITYTSTGDGTSQQDIGVVPEWRSGKARLRPGDFAQFSAQNSNEYGSLSCKIVEHMPDGSLRAIAPVTTSSGAFTIVDCNGTVQ